MKQSSAYKNVHTPATKLSLALYQPDIAGNLGALMRLSACFGVPLHVIGPCGFPFSVRAVRRAAMDYAELAEIVDHDGWSAFDETRTGRLIAMTTRGATPLWDLSFRPGDTILMGQETAGLPEAVHLAADARIAIPIVPPARSLNMATAAAIALAEAVRQLRAP